MAQAATATLRANWAADTAVLSPYVAIQWDGVNWTEETGRVQSMDWAASVQDPSSGLPFLGAAVISSASLTLHNADHRFSADNAASPLYAAIRYGFKRIPVRISMGFWDASAGHERLRQFTGRIWKVREVNSGTPVVMLTLQGMELDLGQFKTSTPLYRDRRVDQVISTLLARANVGVGGLERGMTPIPYLWLDDENVWAECQRLAQADAGMFYCDELGVARYRRITTLLEHADATSSQATLTGRAWEIGAEELGLSAYTRVVVEYTAREQGIEEVLYEEAQPIEVLPGGVVRQFTARYRYPAAALILPVAGTDYQAVSAAGTSMASSLYVALPENDRQTQRCLVRFSNPHAYQSVYVYGFQLRGYPLLGEESHDAAAVVPALTLQTYWRNAPADEKVYRIAENDALQTAAQAERLAGVLRDWLGVPRRLLKWSGPAVPWLQLLDRVTIQDPEAGINADAYVLHKECSYAPDATWDMTLIALPVAELFAYPTYFRLGASTYQDAGSHPLFY